MNEDNKKINLNNMIALCHIVDEFEGFEKRLITAISGKYNRCFIFQLNDVSKGEFKMNPISTLPDFSKDSVAGIDRLPRYYLDNWVIEKKVL